MVNHEIATTSIMLYNNLDSGTARRCAAMGLTPRDVDIISNLPVPLMFLGLRCTR